MGEGEIPQKGFSFRTGLVYNEVRLAVVHVPRQQVHRKVRALETDLGLILLHHVD